MARIGESADLLKCSFCGKSQKQVAQLIAGPGVYICDECVELCNEIIEERLAEANAALDRESAGLRSRDRERPAVPQILAAPIPSPTTCAPFCRLHDPVFDTCVTEMRTLPGADDAVAWAESTNGTTAVTDYSTLPEGIWSGDVSVQFDATWTS